MYLPSGLSVMFQGSLPVATGAIAVATSAPEALMLNWEIVLSALLATYAHAPEGLMVTAHGPCPVATVAGVFGARLPSPWITYCEIVLSVRFVT